MHATIYRIFEEKRYWKEEKRSPQKHKVSGKQNEHISWRSDWADVKHLFKSDDVNIKDGFGDQEDEDDIDFNNDKEEHIDGDDDDVGGDDDGLRWIEAKSRLWGFTDESVMICWSVDKK